MFVPAEAQREKEFPWRIQLLKDRQAPPRSESQAWGSQCLLSLHLSASSLPNVHSLLWTPPSPLSIPGCWGPGVTSMVPRERISPKPRLIQADILTRSKLSARGTDWPQDSWKAESRGLVGVGAACPTRGKPMSAGRFIKHFNKHTFVRSSQQPCKVGSIARTLQVRRSGSGRQTD